MITCDQIWHQLCKKKPALLNPDAVVEITSENLKLLLQQVYEQGEKRRTHTNDFLERVFEL